MPDIDEATYRQAQFRAEGEDVTVREPDEIEADEAMMEIRMPIASTGEVRNEGDDPLTRDELNGMARQLQERQIGVFPAHGNDDKIADSRYSPFERLGNWREGEIESRDGTDVLVATARMPDPEDLPDATGSYREALAILKEQAKRGIGQDSSIGWREDDSFPGNVDLMEASIVGIGADWRTNTSDEAASIVAREAVEAGADPETLVERVARAVESERPLGPPEDPDRFDTFEECKTALMDSGESEAAAERICGAWENAKDEQATHNLDDPEFGEGDAVSWEWDTDTVHGRVADVGDEFTVSGNTITGEEGEAVYLIHEFDDEVSAFRRENVAKPQTSLSASQMDMPPATEDNFQNMTDDETADDGGTTDEQSASDGDVDTHGHIRQSASEIADVAEDIMMGHIEAAMDDIEAELAEMMGEDEAAMDGDGDEDDEDDDEGEMSADTPESEQDGDTSALAERLADLESELSEVRDGGLSSDDVETPDVDETQDADETDEQRETDATEATAGPNWRGD